MSSVNIYLSARCLLPIFHYHHNIRVMDLAESSSLTFSLEKCQNVTFANWSFHVTNERAAGKVWGYFVSELHANLDDATTGAGAAKNLFNFGQLGSVRIHDAKKLAQMLATVGH